MSDVERTDPEIAGGGLARAAGARGLAAFVALYTALDRTTATREKQATLERYLASAPSLDAVWAIHFLIGRRPRRAVPSARLRAWAAEWAGLPGWLVEASYHAVGDLAETLAVLCARGEGGALTTQTLAAFVAHEVEALAEDAEGAQRERLERWWRAFDEATCFVVHKLLTGGFRVGVSATLVARALARVLGREPAQVAHRLMGGWVPGEAFAARLLAADDVAGERSRPYPFFLASPLDVGEDAASALTTLGARDAWLAEWKWDGIRAQLLVRGGETFLWSRGEELITARFPEVTVAARALPGGTVLDGELVPWRDGGPLPFGVLQTRIGRRNLTARALREAPVIFLAFDLLERAGEDVRAWSQRARRAALESIVGASAEGAIRISPLVEGGSWEALAARRAESRARGVEGVMLKRADAPYRVGRTRGDWWKWKVAPHTVDAVLVYAQAGHGRRASLHTDYTFAVWDGEALVPVARAYSGLTDAEIVQLDRWIRGHTLQRFGPVRAVPAHHVFELGFEGVQPSTRHKGGVALRFPRILRWRADKGVREAGTLDELRLLARVAQVDAPHDVPRETPNERAPRAREELSLFDGVDGGDDA